LRFYILTNYTYLFKTALLYVVKFIFAKFHEGAFMLIEKGKTGISY